MTWYIGVYLEVKSSKLKETHTIFVYIYMYVDLSSANGETKLLD